VTDTLQSSPAAATTGGGHVDTVDAIVIGAGLCGLYQVDRLRRAGLSVRCFEEGGGVGGTWYWNRYPGCAFDSPSEEYGYSFSEDVLREWDWVHYYTYQPDAERYLNFVADRLDLRRHIRLNSRVAGAYWHEEDCVWEVVLESGERVSAAFLLASVGGLTAAPYVPSFDGLDSFKGEKYHTGRWPHETVEFGGKRVAVIGSGPSAIQLIPEVAHRCAHLTVLQRTPTYAFPADNEPVAPGVQQEWKLRYPELHQKMKSNYLGVQHEQDPRRGSELSKEERLALYEEAWQRRGYAKHITLFWDLTTDPEIRAEYSEFLRGKIRAQVDDPAVAEKLLPKHLFGAKAAMLENGYYRAFNRDNVLLVDLRETPIERFTETGVVTSDRELPLDMVIFATGYDARTGPMTRIDIRGADGLALKDKWDALGPVSYLGLTIAGFPNLFMGSPGALCSTFTLCAEWSGDWIADVIQHMRERGFARVEATRGRRGILDEAARRGSREGGHDEGRRGREQLVGRDEHPRAQMAARRQLREAGPALVRGRPGARIRRPGVPSGRPRRCSLVALVTRRRSQARAHAWSLGSRDRRRDSVSWMGVGTGAMTRARAFVPRTRTA
jgi:cation diffusion facilitator CzcD-associated flavoprotein CzcO